MHEYEKHGIILNDKIDNVESWYWSTKDQQTYGIIRQEWPVHKETVERLVPKKGVVIQAGGNLGMYPRLYADMFETVYTFEPDPHNFFFLATNCQKDNIIKMQAALGYNRSLVSVIKPLPQNLGMNKVEETTTGNIPTLGIDDLGLRTIDLIHLDVEGYELPALQGGIMTITVHRPVIMCERYDKADEVINFLAPLGYKEAGYSAHDLIMVHEAKNAV